MIASSSDFSGKVLPLTMNYNFVANNAQSNFSGPEFTELGLVMEDFSSSGNNAHPNDKRYVSGAKRSATTAGLDSSLTRANISDGSNDDDRDLDVKKHITQSAGKVKKTKGRVKIKMEFIDNKLRRYTTFSKRKTGIMKKAYELSTLTGTQVMLLVASETGHVYTFATRKLQPMITSESGKALIQTCLNSPDMPTSPQGIHLDQRMCATGFEETELSYNIGDDEVSKDQKLFCSSSPPSSVMSDDEDDVNESRKMNELSRLSADDDNGHVRVPSTTSAGVSLFPASGISAETNSSQAIANSLTSLQPMQAITNHSENYVKTTPNVNFQTTMSNTIDNQKMSISMPRNMQLPGNENISTVSVSSPSATPSTSDGNTGMLVNPSVMSSNANVSFLPGNMVAISAPSTNGVSCTTTTTPTIATLPVMYHTAQGVVYATPTSATLPDGSNVILNFAPATQQHRAVTMPTDHVQGVPQQQYITIPVPMPIASQSQQLVPAVPSNLIHQIQPNISTTKSDHRKSKVKK